MGAGGAPNVAGQAGAMATGAGGRTVVGQAGAMAAGGGGGDAPDPPVVEMGLAGEYWNNLDLSGPPAVSRIDSSVDMLWSDLPPPGVSDVFSARWRAVLLPATTETYQLSLMSDDGSRLWIDGQLLIDQWDGGSNLTTIAVALDPGQPLQLRLELFSVGGSGSIRLDWESPRIPFQTVPTERLRVP